MNDANSSKTVNVRDGIVQEAMKNSNFRVAIDDQDQNGNQILVLANLSGKLRKHYIRIFVGDKVKMEFSPHDPTRGRIIYRY